METTTTQIKMTGTKAALAKIAAALNTTVQEHPRTGARFVNVPCNNAELSLSADARSNGQVAYRTVDGCNHIAATQADFFTIASSN